jgi:hypothetical protein
MILSTLRIAKPIRLSSRIARLSSSPDYLAYETWHRDNYELPHSNNNNAHNHDSTIHKPAWNGIPKNQFQRELPRTSVLMELGDRVGALHDVLKY